jgi:hypothetical protein
VGCGGDDFFADYGDGTEQGVFVVCAKGGVTVAPVVAQFPAWRCCVGKCEDGRMKSDDELRDWYVSLSDSDKQTFLSFVSWQLTIHGRCFGLDLTGIEQINAFKGLNELQHQISSHMAAIGLRQNRYPDDVLWNILSEKAASYGILAHLKQSFDFARSRNSWDKLK